MIAAETVAAPTPPQVSDEEVGRIVAGIGIPPCPAILTAMLRESRKEDPDFAAIGRLLASDLGLAAALLKTVNSPFYGLTSRATSVQQALVFLGLRNVVRLVTGLLLAQAFPVSRNAVVKHLWETSSRIAAGIASLARSLGCADRDEAYTFGLFRDCGMLMMMQKYGDYAELIDAGEFPHSERFLQSESQRYVTHHAHVGFHMARTWYLPDELGLAVRHHHDIAFLAGDGSPQARKSRVLVALGMVVDALIATEGAEGGDTGWIAACAPALQCLGIPASTAALLADDLREACTAETEA